MLPQIEKVKAQHLSFSQWNITVPKQSYSDTGQEDPPVQSSSEKNWTLNWDSAQKESPFKCVNVASEKMCRAATSAHLQTIELLQPLESKSAESNSQT